MNDSLTEVMSGLSTRVDALLSGLSAAEALAGGADTETLGALEGSLVSFVQRAEEVARVSSSLRGHAPAPGFSVPDATLGRIEAIQQRSADLAHRFEKLGATLDGYAEAFAAKTEEVGGSAEELHGGVQEWLEALQEDLERLVVSVSGSVDETLEEARESLEGIADKLEDGVDERLVQTPDELIEDIAGALRDLVSGANEALAKAAGNLGEQITQAIRDLAERTQDHVREELEARLRDTLENVIEQLATDAIENTMLTQLGTTLTASLSPILPQLIAAKVVLGQIKHLLEVMRMGL